MLACILCNEVPTLAALRHVHAYGLLHELTVYNRPLLDFCSFPYDPLSYSLKLIPPRALRSVICVSHQGVLCPRFELSRRIKCVALNKTWLFSRNNLEKLMSACSVRHRLMKTGIANQANNIGVCKIPSTSAE
jgi:hypothetical protein